jgi:hypothetical protein
MWRLLLHLGQPPRTTSRIDPRCRKRLALFVALVLASGAFVLVAGEARAQQQPTAPHQQQQPEIAKQGVPASVTPSGVEEPPVAADKGGAEPVDQEVTVAAPMAVPSLPPKPAPEKMSRTSLSGDPKKPATEKPGATKPGAALPEESPARVLVRPELEPEYAPVGPDSAPPTPASVSDPISDPASEAPPETAPEPVSPEQSDPLPTSAPGEGPAGARALGSAKLPPEEDFFFSGSAPLPEKNSSADDPAAPTGPVLDPYSYSPPTGTPMEAIEDGGVGLAHVLSSFETAANGFGSAMEATRSATTSAAAEVLQKTLVNGAPKPSSSDGAQASATQEEGDTTQPPSQPTAPLLPPLGEGPLFSSSGTGQAGPGSGFVVFLLGVLASGLVLLLWRDGLFSLVSWEVPKPTSALLSPFERPG